MASIESAPILGHSVGIRIGQRRRIYKAEDRDVGADPDGICDMRNYDEAYGLDRTPLGVLKISQQGGIHQTLPSYVQLRVLNYLRKSPINIWMTPRSDCIASY